ncbi:MAG TPA: ATP-binding protein [Burkholderiales bacterium]|nr:ATP-binding protein [Burkholderiales bacterium]
MRWRQITHPSKSLSWQNSLWLGGALLVTAIVASAVYDVAHRREIVIDRTREDGASLARVVAQQIAGLLHTVDVIVRDTGTDALVSPLHELRWTLHERLRERIHAIPPIRDLLVVGTDGRLIASAAQFPVHAASVVNEPYFVAQRLNAVPGVYVSEPSHGRGDRMSTIAISHAIRGPRGEFLGVAVAQLDFDYFRRLYATIALGPEWVLDLFGGDGQLLAQYPDGRTEIGRSFTDQPLLRQLPRAAGPVTAIARSPIDGRDAIYAAQAVPGYPLLVGVGVDKALALAPWRTQAVHSAVRTGLLCLAVVLLIALVMRQLGRREKTEELLRVQTALLDELFESAPEAIVMLSPDEGVTRVNREFTRLFGYAADEARGRPLGELIVPPDLKEESRHIGQAIGQGRHVSRETERVRKDGRRLHVSLLGAPIVTAKGQIASYAIYRDINERVLAQAEREKLALRLRQAEKLEAIGTMAGGIAHDFNNILGAILGYGDMALTAAPEGGVLKRYVGQVMTAAHRAKALVDQILTYSRSTRGKPAAVSVHAVVAETLELVRASLPSNIELRPRLEAPKAAVMADATQIHQLVMNLCKNAVDAMPIGGTLSVTLDVVDTATDRTLSHGLLPAGRHVRLSVEDSGCGMAPAVAERIFEPFFTTKQPGAGTGLGLALLHGIVTELGGAVDVASVPGKGSVFKLYLPRSDAAAMQKVEEHRPLPQGDGECVLLVEDEEPLLLLTEEMLAALGYEPTGFTRAAEALSEFRADPSHFDAVVLDYLMPGMTGTELAAHLRQARSDIPIVLVSGYTGPLLSQEALLAGVRQILTKPLDFRELAESMSHALMPAPVG